MGIPVISKHSLLELQQLKFNFFKIGIKKNVEISFKKPMLPIKQHCHYKTLYIEVQDDRKHN